MNTKLNKLLILGLVFSTLPKLLGSGEKKLEQSIEEKLEQIDSDYNVVKMSVAMLIRCGASIQESFSAACVRLKEKYNPERYPEEKQELATQIYDTIVAAYQLASPIIQRYKFQEIPMQELPVRLKGLADNIKIKKSQEVRLPQLVSPTHSGFTRSSANIRPKRSSPVLRAWQIRPIPRVDNADAEVKRTKALAVGAQQSTADSDWPTAVPWQQLQLPPVQPVSRMFVR